MLFPRKKSQGAPQNSCTLQEELQEQKLMEGSGLLTSKANSGSKEHVKFAVCCKRFFADCVTLSFLRRKQGTQPYLHEFHIPLLG